MTKKTILIAEDEPSIAEVVTLYLQRGGFQPSHAQDGEIARTFLETQIPDLCIIDIMLPGMDGLSLTRWLRARSNVPIILLTSRREEVDRIAGLEMGADDYVVKPFSPQELVSRVRAVLRRTGREDADLVDPNPPTSLAYNDITIDPRSHSLSLAGKEIPLTAKEFEMLHLMMRHPRQAYTRDQLLERIWGVTDYIDPGTVTVHIRRLREKIETDPSSPRRIVTVWGVGYKFEP
jgi:DNA-binding response OmpR family regulator